MHIFIRTRSDSWQLECATVAIVSPVERTSVDKGLLQTAQKRVAEDMRLSPFRISVVFTDWESIALRCSLISFRVNCIVSHLPVYDFF